MLGGIFDIYVPTLPVEQGRFCLMRGWGISDYTFRHKRLGLQAATYAKASSETALKYSSRIIGPGNLHSYCTSTSRSYRIKAA